MTETLHTYEVGGEAFDAYVARPSGRGPFPTVLVCHPWGGRNDFTEDKTREYAKAGYLAAAINLYGVGKRGHDRASSEALMSSLTENPERLRERLRGAYDAVLRLDDVDASRVGTVGYCFGGLCAILMARMGLPELRGAVSFHGLLKMGEPVDGYAGAKILVLHGQDDPMVPVADIAAFSEEMRRVHADWQLHVYPNTVHAFTNPAANDAEFGTVYNADADRRSWRTTMEFLAELFGTPAPEA